MSEKKNQHDVLINVVELASELAHNQLEKDYSDLIEIYQDTDEDDVHYTEEAQDIFNDLYDRYYDLVLSCESNDNSISTDILSYEDEEGHKVYDIEQMVDDFANKLNDLQPDGIGLEITFK